MRISDWSSDVCSSDLRHVVDSAQLLDWADRDGSWLDVGAGAGFPGMLVALLSDRPVALCEPRKRRAAFLERAAAALDIADRVTIAATKNGRASCRERVCRYV